MIFYFSGTGNSEWVAQQLARLTGDEAVDITTLQQVPPVRDAARLGFVFPVYAWGAPEPMNAFARRLEKSGAFAFGVCTCGGEAGLAMKRFVEVYPLNSSYSLVMPNNYIVGTDTESDAVIGDKLARAAEELARIAAEIVQQQPVYRVKEGKLAKLKSSVANFGFNRFARSAKPFSAGDSCNGCGLCAAGCPAHAVSMHSGRPVWAAQCFQCMRCINQCPTQAIQYGKATVGRRRYLLKNHLPQG